MDKCIVCLCRNQEDNSRIYMDDAEAQNHNIQHIIEKHLCWWYLKPSSQHHDETWICLECWQQLLTFHNFYLKAEKVHKHYESELMVATNENQHNNTLREEEVFPDHEVEYEVTIEALDGDNEVEIFETLESQDESGSVQKFTMELNDNNTICDKNEKDCKPKEKIQKHKPENTKTTIKRSKSLKIRQPRGKNHIVKQESRKENDNFLSRNKFQFICDICSLQLNNFGQLKLHYQADHKMRAYAKCCRKKYYERSTLVDHLMVHQNPSYFKCKFCDKCLANRRYFEKHLQSHQKSKKILDKTFRCEQCNKSFSMKIIYKRHLLTHVPNAEKKFPCLECGKKFASSSVLNQHTALVHLNKYAKVCDICAQSFRHREYYERHMAQHKGILITKFSCDLCDTQLASKYALNHHKKLKHTAENLKEQMCPYCEKISPNMYTHKMHIRYVHETDRKHACEMCDKKFKKPYQLRDHMSTHTGVSQHKCPYCEKSLSTNGNLLKHCRKFHFEQNDEDSLNGLPVSNSGETQEKDKSLPTLISKSSENFSKIS